ncbi:TlpA family protein disulfide reductase [Aliikangiella sp. IMCC44653]
MTNLTPLSLKMPLILIVGFLVNPLLAQPKLVDTNDSSDPHSLSTASASTSLDLAPTNLAAFTGDISPQSLLKTFKVFSQEFDRYSPTTQEVELFSKLKSFDFKVFFGTWCHDSQREVPRLIKLAQLSGVPLSQIQLIALNQDKQLPPAYRASFKVQFTPSIFLLKNNKIVNQVIETPHRSLAQDLAESIN